MRTCLHCKGTSFLLVFVLVFWMQNAFAQKVYWAELKEDVGAASWRIIKKGYQEALEKDADYLMVDMNTYGGVLNFADSIRSLILDSEIPTVVYVNKNAASAGALISLAADYIFMRSGASIGAATVVDQQGEQLSEKYQSYMRGLMRSTAEAKDRDPIVAESFVDPRVIIPGFKEDTDKLVTLTSDEALKLGIINAKVQGVNDIYRELNIQAEEVFYERTWVDAVIGFLVNPLVSGLLIMGLIGGIYFELQTPGVGFALVFALLCGGLFFGPLYIQGLADNWEIVIFFIGVLLLCLEIYVIPGFGITGILGIILILCGLTFSMVSNDFLDFKLSHPNMLFNSFVIVIGAMVLSIVLMVIFGRNILQSSAFKRIILQDEQQSNEGYTSSVRNDLLLNKQGIARTVLRPSGKIEIDGVWYDAIALGGYIEKGEQVYVERHESYNLFVRRVE